MKFRHQRQKEIFFEIIFQVAVSKKCDRKQVFIFTKLIIYCNLVCLENAKIHEDKFFYRKHDREQAWA